MPLIVTSAFSSVNIIYLIRYHDSVSNNEPQIVDTAKDRKVEDRSQRNVRIIVLTYRAFETRYTPFSRP